MCANRGLKIVLGHDFSTIRLDKRRFNAQMLGSLIFSENIFLSAELLFERFKIILRNSKDENRYVPTLKIF